MNHRDRTLACTWVMLGLLVGLVGCKTQDQTALDPGEPDYTRPLPPGESALRKLPKSDWPDMTTAAALAMKHRANVLAAAERSLRWFDKPSTKEHFPVAGISHQHAHATVAAFRKAMTGPDEYALMTALREDFDVYTSVGWDMKGTVLFTGYYSPVFEASRTPTGRFRYPLYRRPPDLASDPVTGEILGRNVGGGRIAPYPTRQQLEQSGILTGSGLELVYLASKIDAYIIHVNGSAKLDMTDGSTMYIGYAGTNGREYTSIGQLLVREGRIPKNELSLLTLRRFFSEHPDEVDRYTMRNERYVFFEEYGAGEWPAGSLGFKVTPWRTLATDKAIYPRAVPLFVSTQVTDTGSRKRPFVQLMFDQDTGGAIRAPGRADIYMGIGADAEGQAGRQADEGRLYYLLLREDRISDYLR